MNISTGTICAIDLLKTSDWVLIWSSLALAASALLAPYVSEWLKRKWFAPKFEIIFQHENPFCHKTEWTPQNSVYYFRFQIKNTGKSQAHQCEAVLEELWIVDSAGEYHKEKNFCPVNLRWVASTEQFISINPGRTLFCDIGHINDPNTQQTTIYYRAHQYPGYKFFFDCLVQFKSQPDYINPGRAIIKISIYSTNAKRVNASFEISWSGNWKTDELDMFREIVIKKL